MSADESFLARWARRKRAAATKAPDDPPPKGTRDGAAAESGAAALPSGETQSLVDPKSLPPIETIDAESDIRPFLADRVPVDLTRAALRRAWSADPAIRDFIGLSENSWDFNAPSGVPGFGALTLQDARRLLTQLTEKAEALGLDRPAAEQLANDQVPAVTNSQKTTGRVADQVKPGPDTDADHHQIPMLRGEKSNIAVQHKRQEREPRLSGPRRRHGGALPG